MVDIYISPEAFSALPPAEQDKLMREWLVEFSRDELLIIKRLIEINRPAETER